MWMNASSTTVGASTLVSTQWAATSAAAKRASSSATTSTRAFTALLVSICNTKFEIVANSSTKDCVFVDACVLCKTSKKERERKMWQILQETDDTMRGDRFKLAPVTELSSETATCCGKKNLCVPQNKISQ